MNLEPRGVTSNNPVNVMKP